MTDRCSVTQKGLPPPKLPFPGGGLGPFDCLKSDSNIGQHIRRGDGLNRIKKCDLRRQYLTITFLFVDPCAEACDSLRCSAFPFSSKKAEP